MLNHIVKLKTYRENFNRNRYKWCKISIYFNKQRYTDKKGINAVDVIITS